MPTDPTATDLTTPSFSIKTWSEDDRPREKLLLRGAKALSTAELLAILLGSGSRGESAVQLAQHLLHDADNDLHKLGKRTLAQLKTRKGMGDAKAITIIAALEIAQRRLETPIRDRPTIGCSQDAYLCLAGLVSNLPHEEFWVLLLNRANQVTGRKQISIGGVSSTVVDAKMVFGAALENRSAGIVLCHNHPSGSLQPSQADIDLTRKLRQAAQLLDITLIDHLIITEAGYYSFADETGILG